MCWKCFKKLELATEHEKSLSKLVKELTCTTAVASSTVQEQTSVLEIGHKKKKKRFEPQYEKQPKKKMTTSTNLTIRLEESEEDYEDCESDMNTDKGDEECVNNSSVEEEEGDLDIKVNDLDILETLDSAEIESEKQEEHSELLFVGKQYSKFEDFKRDLHNYCQDTYTDMALVDARRSLGDDLSEDTPYKEITFGCKLMKKRGGSKSKGIRKRKSSDCGCTWGVKLLLSLKTDCYVIKKFNPDHINHTNSYSTYWSDYELTDEEQKKYLDDYHLGLKMTLVDVTRKLRADTKKVLTHIQLKNWLKWRHPSYI